MRRFTDDTLVIASHNPGKLVEIADLMTPLGITVKSAGDLNVPEPAETEDSYEGNAILKATHSMKCTGLPALADDSGLAVEALYGAPGIYSARWAGPAKDFRVAMAKIEDALGLIEGQTGETPDRTAKFVCALALAWPDGHVEVVEGTVEGRLVWPPRGDKGFGYDPMFVPEGHEETFGEVSQDWKHSVSHRANAFQKLMDGVFGDRDG